MFSIWDENNRCLSWQETEEYCHMLDLRTVPVLFVGKWKEEDWKNFQITHHQGDECEGYVVRVSRDFRYAEFKRCVAKYVRPCHVKTDKHWSRNALVLNEIKVE